MATFCSLDHFYNSEILHYAKTELLQNKTLIAAETFDMFELGKDNNSALTNFRLREEDEQKQILSTYQFV